MSADRDHTVNFAKIIDGPISRRPDDVALIQADTGDSVTYRKLGQSIARAGNSLAQLGVGKHDRVGLLFPNEISFLHAFFGAIRLGAVPVPLNIRLTPENLKRIVANSGAAVIISSGQSEISSIAIDIGEKLDSIESIVIDDEDLPESPTVQIRSYPQMMKEVASTLHAASVGADDPCFQPYTSGSTGQPKGIVHSHAGTVWNSTVNRNVQLLDATDRSICAAPIYHKNTLIGAVKPLLQAGGSIVVDNFDAEGVIASIDSYEATCFRGVPAMFRLLLDALHNADEYDVSSLAWAVSGAGPLPPSLADEFADAFGTAVGQSYGLTECGPVLLTPRWGSTDGEFAPMPLPGVETLIRNPDTGAPVDSNQVGELLVFSPGTGRYFDEGNNDAFEIIDGTHYLRTGDIAIRDERGRYNIVGRLDDLLNVGGNKVSPLQVEERLERHHQVREAAVVGVPHSIKGEVPVAFVVSEGSIDEQRLKEYMLEHGPKFAHPRRIFFDDAIPLASTGKVDRQALEQQALDLVNNGMNE